MNVNDQRDEGQARRARVSVVALLLSGLFSGAGCNALEEPVDERLARAPKDSRPPITAERPPPPVSGGTLMATADDRYAVASDPDRDQIYVVSLAAGALEHRIELEQGDEPGRLAEGADGRIHVALRGSGELLTLHAEQGEVLMRRAVCRAPRGLAFDGDALRVHVACADGRVVSFDEMSPAPTRVAETTEGLRDVMVRGGALLVSRFKTAELLSVTDDGRLEPVVRAGGLLPLTNEGAVESPMNATTAWKTVATPTGRVVMVHQRATEAEIDLEPSSDESGGVEGDSPYGGGAFGNSCDGIVHAAVTEVTAEGEVHSTLPLMGTVLPVDVAVWGEWVAIADAGTKDPDAPATPVLFGDGDFASDILVSSASNLSLVHAEELQSSPAFPSGSGCVFPRTIPIPETQVTSVAFTGGGTLLALSREPAALHAVQVGGGDFGATTIPLDERSVRDTGHDVFHRDAGQGIACASCHPEGGDDGHTWHFQGALPRRTQSLFVDLSATLPLHWAGDIQDVDNLMTEVFVGRMGGALQSPERLDALDTWLNDFPAPSPALAADDPAVERGKAIFEDASVGCVACHNGSALTDNHSYDVGTGEVAQVPSLVGVAYRAPFMRSGCATTLLDRFEPGCGGGDAHGHTSHLAGADLEDLVAYLRSL